MQGFEVIQQHTVLDNAIYHLFIGACNNDATLQHICKMFKQCTHQGKHMKIESPFAEENKMRVIPCRDEFKERIVSYVNFTEKQIFPF